MSDKDQNNDEEYHFAVEPDDSEPSIEDSEEFVTKKSTKLSFDKNSINDFFEKNVVARNSLVGFAVVIILLILYNFTASLLDKSKKNASSSMTQINTKIARPQQKITPVYTRPIQKVNDDNAIKEALDKKLTNVEENQASIKSQVAAMSSQSDNLNANFNVLLDKMTKLSQQVETLSATLEDQSHIIMTLNQRMKSKPQRRATAHYKSQPSLKYSVQAVIPGRAWLIATNGSTLTARVGTIIPGYGSVKIIDTMQGRVLTSSGQIIKFSQEDS